MNKKVILVNLGNRNLKYKNKGYKNDFIPVESFRSISKSILDNFEYNKEDLELNILSPILTKFSNAEVILFGTNQGENNNQDTIYEAQIIKRLITESFPEIQIRIEILENINPSSEDDLIPYYTNFVKKNYNNFKDRELIYFDSGGTPQQKSSLRAVLEFYIPNNKLNQFYGANKDGTTVLKKLTRTQSEELKQKRQIKNLLLTYNYSAVKQLAEDIQTQNSFHQLNDILILLWNGLYKDIKKKYPIQQLSKGIKKHSNHEKIKEIYLESVEEIHFHKSILLLNKFHALLKSGDYSGSIITLQQLIETYVLGLVSKHVSIDLSTTKSYFKSQEKVLTEVIEMYGDEITEEYGREVKSFSLPIQLIFLGIVSDVSAEEKELITNIKKVITTFEGPIPNNQRLDVFRNAIAHKGKGVTKDVFNGIYKDFVEELDNYFNYKEDENIYDLLNNMAIDFL